MKSVAVAIALATTTFACPAQKSAFATVRFGDVVQVDLPRSWTYLDPKLAAHLNTSSEALSRTIGLEVLQGDNVVLVAANAHDSAGKTRATLRISIRTAPGLRYRCGNSHVRHRRRSMLSCARPQRPSRRECCNSLE